MSLANVIAIVLQLSCLAFSGYVLGLDGPIADNFFGTFIESGVGDRMPVLRLYFRWVYRNMPLPIEHPVGRALSMPAAIATTPMTIATTAGALMGAPA